MIRRVGPHGCQWAPGRDCRDGEAYIDGHFAGRPPEQAKAAGPSGVQVEVRTFGTAQPAVSGGAGARLDGNLTTELSFKVVYQNDGQPYDPLQLAIIRQQRITS